MVTGNRAARIGDLQVARVERLGRLLAASLEGGHVIADTSSVSSVDEWRKAARQAAADRDWRVRTGITRDGSRVWAIRLDRETTAEDRAVLRDRLGYIGALLSKR